MPVTPSLQYQTRPDYTPAPARDLYRALMDEALSPELHRASRAFLEGQLQQAARLPCDMPFQAGDLESWIESKAAATAERYAHYLEDRKRGEARRYFASRSHALSFLQQVAPTKLVDGAWLYGALQHWDDDRFYPLIRTYLEELGDGLPEQNHVVIYRRLLARYGCEILPELSDGHYVQGAIQLCLAYSADRFMPEVIGYNLGYEQLPLHLLISALELDELGIDPYYFTLHVTVDNAGSGHARKAVNALLGMMPAADSRHFLQRVANGYRLNDLGLGTNDVIAAFDLDHELVRMLQRKSSFGKHLHSDFCAIGGRTVNEWLSHPSQIPGFLRELEGRGWIKRHEDPDRSRFWRLVDGDQAPMHGVFSPVEKQLLYDWIAGHWSHNGEGLHASSGSTGTDVLPIKDTLRRRAAPGRIHKVPIKRPGDLVQAGREFQQELECLPQALRMQRLIGQMSPSGHHTDLGLIATRLFSEASG